LASRTSNLVVSSGFCWLAIRRVIWAAKLTSAEGSFASKSVSAKRSGSRAALVSWAAGLIVWAIVKYGFDSTDQTLVVALPLATSLVVYVGLGLLLPENRPEVDELLDSLNTDPEEVTARPAHVLN